MLNWTEFNAKYASSDQGLRDSLEELIEQLKKRLNQELEFHYLLRNLYTRLDELSRHRELSFIRNLIEFAEAGQTLRIIDAQVETHQQSVEVTQ
jgi:hypothetical protein